MTPNQLISTLKELNWTGNELCRRTGIHASTVSRWRKGHYPIPKWVVAYLSLAVDLKRVVSNLLEPG